MACLSCGIFIEILFENVIQLPVTMGSSLKVCCVNIGWQPIRASDSVGRRLFRQVRVAQTSREVRDGWEGRPTWGPHGS